MNQEFASNVCSNCHSDDRWILHNVRHRGTYHRLCTSCVLKLHPSSFCPHCFLLFDSPLHHSSSSSPHPPSSNHNHHHHSLNRGTLLCIKCSSHSHSTCIPPNSPKSPYLCPPCSTPHFKFFNFRPPGSGAHIRDVRISNRPEQQLSLDQRSAKALLAAAKIAAGSMIKATALARLESERRVKEAAFARKRAKESLERVAMLSRRGRAGGAQIQGSVPPQKRDCFVESIQGSRHPPRAMNNIQDNGTSGPRKVNIVGGGASGVTRSSVCGRKQGGYGAENAAVHMDIDATVEEVNEGMRMGIEDSFAVHNEGHLRCGDGLVSGTVKGDAGGGTEMGMDVQTLVVQVEKNGGGGGMIASGSGVGDGTMFQVKDAASLEEKGISGV